LSLLACSKKITVWEKSVPYKYSISGAVLDFATLLNMAAKKSVLLCHPTRRAKKALQNGFLLPFFVLTEFDG